MSFYKYTIFFRVPYPKGETDKTAVSLSVAHEAVQFDSCLEQQVLKN